MEEQNIVNEVPSNPYTIENAEDLFIGYKDGEYVRYSIRTYFYDLMVSEATNNDCFDTTYGKGKWIILHKVDTPTVEEMETLDIVNGALVKASEEIISKRLQDKLNSVINKKIDEVHKYDSSSEINIFYMGDTSLWLNKSDRVSLSYAIGVEEALGHEVMAFWANGINFPVPIANAKLMLNQLEWYAKQCYDNTQTHIAAIKNLKTAEEIKNYDITIGYPNKLKF